MPDPRTAPIPAAQPTQPIPPTGPIRVTQPIGPHPPAADRRTGPLRTLGARTILASAVAALVSVLVTALVAFPLAIRSANSEARQGLADKAALTADWLGTRPSPVAEERIVSRLRDQKIAVYLIRGGIADRSGLPDRVVASITNRQRVSTTGVVGGRLSLIEGRLLTGAGNGVVLTEKANTGVAGVVFGRLGLALLAGLVAGAIAGGLLGRRLARPIRNAARAAVRLATGDRSVRLAPEPPAEVEELANALNALASALATSEGRQREFLLSISHELRTPLTTLKGYAEALADGVVGPDGAQRAGQTMLGEAEHLDRLVADLLALARLEAADFPISVLPVDLTALVADAAEAWGGRCSQVGVVLRRELPEGPVIVLTDPGRIRQVVDGLLENALRVVPPGAPAVLAVHPPAPAGQLRPGTPVPAPLPPGYPLLEVRDGGPGFTDADLALVFERGAMYERYRGVRKVGSGLGLALAGGLVRRLGGVIVAGHAPEGGARFTVALPPYQARTPH